MKRSKKWLTAIALSAIVCGTGVPIIVTAIENRATTWDDINADDYSNFVVGDTLNLPSRKVNVDGVLYDSTVTLTYPDGSVVAKSSTVNTVTLDQPGLYKFTFEARAGSSRKKQEETFTVANKLWSVGSSKSSVEYGTHKHASVPGLNVRLAKGDTLTFNKIIDLSEIDSSTQLFNAFITPETKGSPDFSGITFTFTDVYDPSCYMRVYGRRSFESSGTAVGVSYWTAGANGQGLSGWINNVNYHYNDGSGCAMNTSFCCRYVRNWDTGEVVEVDANFYPIKIYYNPTNQELRTQNWKLADLDEPEDHTTEALWEGFTSGKVRLTVTANDYIGPTANFCISELIGYDLTAENKFVEDDLPVITVDVDEELVDVTNGKNTFKPTAVVGGSYPVPEATAFDAYSGDVKVKTTVYFNYAFTGENSPIYAVKNGRFNVDREGAYTIIYTATDAFGNTAKSYYWINSVAQLDNPLSVNVPSGAASSALCGERFRPVQPVISGGSGATTLTVTASKGDETLEAQGDGSFVFETPGSWTLTYSVTDYAGITREATHTVTVANGTQPVFTDSPELPDYYVSGVPYYVPTLYAYDYSTGTKRQIVSTVEIEDSTGKKTYEAGEKFTPTILESNPVLKLKFTAGTAQYEAEVPAVVPFYKEGRFTRFDIGKMFITDDFTTATSEDGLKLSAKRAGNLEWRFANPVVAEGGSVSVKGLGMKSNFDSMEVTFTDVNDRNTAVTMKLVKGAGGAVNIRFGDTDRELTKGFVLGNDAAGNSLDDFTFSYAYGKFLVDSIAVNVARTDGGAAFNGFPSGKIIISVKVTGAASNSEYLVTDVDNHQISAILSDMFGPRIAVSGEYGGMYNINDTYTLTRALVSDVVDASVKCTLTVKNPDGTVASDVNGLRLEDVEANAEYTIKLTAYGQYTVEYTSVDFGRNEETLSYTVNIVDRVAPTIKLAKGYATKAKVGDVIYLPEAVATDDNTASGDIVIYRAVRNAKGVLNVLGYEFETDSNGKRVHKHFKYTLGYEGEYTVITCAVDAAGNQTTVEYKVTVTG